MTGPMVALLAGAAGVAQAALLRRAARLGSRPAGVFLRLLLVGAALGAAAHADLLATGVAGWGAGFAASILVLARRSS